MNPDRLIGFCAALCFAPCLRAATDGTLAAAYDPTKGAPWDGLVVAKPDSNAIQYSDLQRPGAEIFIV